MTSILLGDDQNPTGDNTPPPAEALSTLVGEGKKFKDVESLAKAKLEADSFIGKLTDETAKLRAELEKRMTLEEQLAALTRGEGGQPGGGQPAPGQGNQPPTNTSVPDVEALLDKKLRERSEQERRQANIRQVDELLLKHYGDANKAKAAVLEFNSTLGINLTDLAASSPAAVAKLIGGSSGSGSGLPAERGTVNVGGNMSGEVRNKAYYDKLRSEMGNARFYADRKLQVQIHKDAQSLGDAYYN